MTMDACKKIWFYTPAQLAGQLVRIIGIPAALIVIAALFA
jgi:hypothetical protein